MGQGGRLVPPLGNHANVWNNVLTGLAAPAAPSVSNAGSGGTVAAGVYKVEITYVNANGETTASAFTSTTTSGTTSTITITSPPASGNATGWYAYVTQAGGSTYTRQQTAGSPTAIGTDLTLTAAPTNTGANPPASNTAGGINGNAINTYDCPFVSAFGHVDAACKVYLLYSADGTNFYQGGSVTLAAAGDFVLNADSGAGYHTLQTDNAVNATGTIQAKD